MGKLYWKLRDISRNKELRAAVVILLAVFSISIGTNILFLRIPFLTAIVQTMVPMVVIGSTIGFVLKIGRFDKVKKSSKRIIYFVLLVILGGWIGMSVMIPIYRYIFHYQITFGIIRTLFLSVTFFAVVYGLIVYGFDALRNQLEKTAAKLAEKEINEKNLLRLKTKAELTALRAKVNPHFLFNTLNSIAGLIPIDPARAEEMVLKLSSLFRYTLAASSRDMVKLSEELNFIKEYLEIEKVRLGERLEYSIDMDEKLADIMIPGLLLQPLVENSVKHGIASKQTGGEISIKCTKENTQCHIEIKDSGKGFEGTPLNGGFGLYGVRERLDLHYRNNYDLQITSEHGVRVFICIPLKESGILQT